MYYLLALLAGLLVSIATAAILDGKKATSLPGGSLGIGLITGFATDANALVTALFGLVGWAVYVASYNYLTRNS